MTSFLSAPGLSALDELLFGEKMKSYGSRWNRESREYLTQNIKCLDCGQAATQVDHRTPHGWDEKKFWDRRNWAPRCHSCHSKKTASRDGGYGNPIATKGIDRDPASLYISDVEPTVNGFKHPGHPNQKVHGSSSGPSDRERMSFHGGDEALTVSRTAKVKVALDNGQRRLITLKYNQNPQGTNSDIMQRLQQHVKKTYPGRRITSVEET